MNIKFFILFLITALSFNDYGTSNSTEDIDFGSWEIKNGILIENDADITSLALYNWNVFYNIFPKKITQKYIKRLVLFSDGEDEKTGALGALNRSNTEWQLVLDPADVNFKTNDVLISNTNIEMLHHDLSEASSVSQEACYLK